MRRVMIGMAIVAGLASPALAQGQPSAEPALQAQAALTTAEMRALLDATRETAKATREAVDYARVMPDILQQILAKLDKIEDKLDKVENAIKAQNRKR